MSISTKEVNNKIEDQMAAEIGHRLRTVADELHMDIRMMCFALGNITRSTLSKYYTGELHIPEDKRNIVRDVLHEQLVYMVLQSRFVSTERKGVRE